MRQLQRGQDGLGPSYIHAGWRGQSIVEFALAIPIFIFILFVTLELGMLFKSYSAYDQAEQEALRIGAAAGNNATADAQILTQLQQTLPAENLNNIATVTIFDATVNGATVTPTAQTQTVYIYQGGQFVCQSAVTVTAGGVCPGNFWNPSTRNTIVGSLDFIGLQVRYNYKGATGLFPLTQFTQSAVGQIEPSFYKQTS